MTLATFRATAAAANLSVYVVFEESFESRGGWSNHFPIGVIEMEAADTLHSEMAPELIFGEVLERQLLRDLESGVVIAKTADGHIVGGWGDLGYFIGSQRVFIDDVAVRVRL